MKKGFTLTEILITICILAIMAAIAVPTFNAARTKNQAAQAMSYLRAIRMAEMMNYSKWGTYQSNIASLGVETAGSPYAFTYQVLNAGNPTAIPPVRPSFRLTATGPGGTITLDSDGTWGGTYAPLPAA